MLEKRVWWRINRAQQAEVQQTKQAPSGGEVAYDCASCGCVSKLVRQGTLSLEVTVVRAGQLGLGAVGAWDWEGSLEGRGALRGALSTVLAASRRWVRRHVPVRARTPGSLT